MTDDVFMNRALRLAVLGRHASPNPMVGCVLVGPDGNIVGEGFHPQAGMPHAEVYALRQAGAAARGATAYVTLEPCAHHGRTPPCAEALLAAGIAQAVVAIADPDPRVAGRGIERLRAGGVSVMLGVGEARARALNSTFLKHRMTGVPWVTLKTAATLDGRIATVTGDSRWITAPVSRQAVHRQLRDRCDAILTGVGTVLADNPSLTTRLMHRPGRNPWRVIADSQARTPLTAQVIRRASEDGHTIIAVTDSADPMRLHALAAAGCGVLVCAADASGQVDLTDLLRRLGTRGDIIGVLVESGGELAAGLLAAGLVDRWVQFVAPKIVGGRTAPGLVGGAGVTRMIEAVPMKIKQVRRSGPDLVIDARFSEFRVL